MKLKKDRQLNIYQLLTNIYPPELVTVDCSHIPVLQPQHSAIQR